MQQGNFGSSCGTDRGLEGLVTVVDAVQGELAKLPGALAESGVAALALALAETVDDPETRPTAKAMCARELREVLNQLRTLAPPKAEKNKIDELTTRRAHRRERTRRRAAS